MKPYLKMLNISKNFHGVQALQDISVDFYGGEIHVIIGENGAGKSTLMKIAAGMYKASNGNMQVEGQEVSFNSPLDAIEHKISMIHQELMPVPYLTVAENIFLGREPLNKFGLLDKKKLYDQTKELLQSTHIEIDPYAPMYTLSVAQIQLVEIAKAVSFHSELLIMDEPTSAISDKEIEALYELIFDLKKQGVAIVFISHKLDEIFKVADKITVLRDGEFIGTKKKEELNHESLIAMMIGREISNVFEKSDVKIGAPILEVKNLTKKGVFENISFVLHENEILGISGLMGAGRTEVVEAIFGISPYDSGEVFIKGKKVEIKNVQDALEHKIALIPEDRKVKGLNLKDTTRFNIGLCYLKELKRKVTINQPQEKKVTADMIEEMRIKVTSGESPVVSLSGGNQQKVVIAKWLLTDPDILIMDEPTRGIDIGAKKEIYRLITHLAESGKSIIMVSSELPEIIGLSDRVVVLCEGIKTGELKQEDIDQQRIMEYATNCVSAAK